MLLRRTVSALALLVSVLAPTVYAQTGRNVLVVANEDVPGSVEVAERYASVRAVPGEQIVRLRAGTAEAITRADFERTVQTPIAAWLSARTLQDQILYIVLARGVPLRIVGTTGGQGTGASVESELALLYRRMTGTAVAPAGPVGNPYFSESGTGPAPFSRAEYDVFLVTRLDGFTTADALDLIDRCPSSATPGRILLDDLPLLTDPRNRWLARAAERLAAAGTMTVVHDTTSRPLVDEAGVIGYFSWGSNDRALARRHPNLTFVPGAIAAMFLSTDARTFAAPPDTWVPGGQPRFAGSNQSLLGDLIRAGVTGAAGQIDEPFLLGAVRPDVLFPAYLAGRTLGEAFYRATPNLSWQTVIVGDPLCSPFRSRPETMPDTPIDPATEHPQHFSARRLAAMTDPRIYGTSEAVRKLLLKAEGRIARSDPEGAVAALDEAVRLDPAATGAWRVLGQLHEGAGRHAEATAAYRQVLQLDRDDVTALNNLAYHMAVRERKPLEALPLATRASTLARGNPLIADTLGWIHHLLGNDREALPFMDRAARAIQEDAEVQLRAAVVYAAVGRLQDAGRALEAAARADPAIRERDDYREVRKAVEGKVETKNDGGLLAAAR